MAAVAAVMIIALFVIKILPLINLTPPSQQGNYEFH
jgi:hypothetical protein